MIRGASSRGMPCPKSAGAEPTPPKFPQPRTIRVTEIPLRPSSRRSIPRSYEASTARTRSCVGIRNSTNAPATATNAAATNTPE